MTPPARPTRRSASKSGIALVVVLGLLSMLVVLAVAFFVSMRTERIAARGYSDQIRARNIAMTGIARAIADVDLEMNGQNRVYPNWPNEVRVSTNNPPGVLYTADYGDTFVQPADLAWTNIPASLLRGVLQERPNIQWVTNCLPAADGGNLVGRYAYMVINCSGLYDVNRDHSLTNKIVFTRGAGTNACEIAVTNVFFGELALTGFRLVESRLTAGAPNRGKMYTEAVSVADLYPIGRYPGFSVLNSTAMVSNLFVYSKAPQGYADANLNSRTNVWIGGTETDVSGKRTNIEAAFVAMGMPANEASMMAANVIDYVDADFVPGGINGGGVSSGPNCDGFATEAVPMLHQFRISEQIDPAGGGGYTATLKLRAQVWYPFISPTNSGSYSLRAELVVNGNGYTMATPGPLTASPPMAGPWAWVAPAGKYASQELIFTATTTTTNTPNTPTSLTIRKLEIIDAAGRVVDRVTAPPPAGPNITLPWATFFNPGGGELKSSWWWCCDPRVNWLLDPAATVAGQLANGQWMTGAVRADADPDWTTHHPNSRGENGRFEMYVRNQGNLVTVGELGLLVCSNYVGQATTDWQTLRLMDTAVGRLYPVFDYFTADVNPVTYGLVNPINPVNYRPMASVFLSTPVERYPGEGGLAPTRIDVAQATQLGQQFAAVSRTIAVTNIINRSDIGREAVGAFQNIAGAVVDDLQRESVLRNSGNLISPRQNMFIILVIGQAITDSNPRDGQVTVNNGEVRGEANAMALVWRDPYKINGRNRYSIRWIKWWREDGGP